MKLLKNSNFTKIISIKNSLFRNILFDWHYYYSILKNDKTVLVANEIKNLNHLG